MITQPHYNLYTSGDRKSPNPSTDKRKGEKMAGWPQMTFDFEKGYSHCFGCGRDNPIGLKLEFKWDGKTAKAEFTPTQFHQGWSGIVHGGIIACLLDEAMGYATRFAGMNCVTAGIQVRLRRTALIGEPLIITSSITENKRRLVKTQASISLKDGVIVAEATATQFVIKSKSRKVSPKGENNA